MYVQNLFTKWLTLLESKEGVVNYDRGESSYLLFTKISTGRVQKHNGPINDINDVLTCKRDGKVAQWSLAST